MVSDWLSVGLAECFNHEIEKAVYHGVNAQVLKSEGLASSPSTATYHPLTIHLPLIILHHVEILRTG